MSGVIINGSFLGAEGTIGTVDGILKAASSPLFQDDIARMFYSYMSSELDNQYRKVAFSSPERYGHMYDWNMLGRPGGKLWRHQLTGRPGRRNVTYGFIPSVINVPASTPANTGISASDFPELRNNGKHMFPNKAMVFESGKVTIISPRNAKAMFIPLKHKSRSGMKPINYRGEVTDRDRKRGFIWVRKPVEQRHDISRGAFTTFYLTFYSQNSDRVFMEKVEPRINSKIRKVYLSNMPDLGGGTYISRPSRRGYKEFSVRAVANASKNANAELSREMKAAVREALSLTEDFYDD